MPQADGPRPAPAPSPTGASLELQIERAFAEATKANLRPTQKALERLIPQLKDPAAKARYFQALDHLPDLVAHEVHE